MKIVLALILMLPVTAFASKARLSALQGASFLTDIQFMLTNPGQLNHLNSMVNYETGSTTNNGAPKSEGGIIRDKMFGGKMSVYLGHINAVEKYARSSATVPLSDNQVTVVYGKNNWGASATISRSDDKRTDEKESTLILAYGMDTKEWELYGNIHLISSAETATNEYNAAPLIVLGGEKNWKDNYHAQAKLIVGSISAEINNADADTKVLVIESKILDRTLRKGVTNVYYGPGLNYESLDVDGNKIQTWELPVYLGVTHQLKDWIELRASIAQNVIFGSEKDETQTAPNDEERTIDNNTTVAVGAGFSSGNFLLDATFEGSSSGKANGNELLANIGLTFTF